MSVRQYDSPLRLFVASNSRAKLEHLVELDAFDGIGQCKCEDFLYRCEPELKQGLRNLPELRRCRHIKEARDFVLDKIIATIAQQQKEKEKPKREDRKTRKNMVGQ